VEAVEKNYRGAQGSDANLVAADFLLVEQLRNIDQPDRGHAISLWIGRHVRCGPAALLPYGVGRGEDLATGLASAANPKFALHCRESDCELRVQSGTRIIELLVSFDSEVRFGACGILRRTSESGH